MTDPTPPAAGTAAEADAVAGRRRPRAPLWWRRFQLLPRPLRLGAWVGMILVLALLAGTATGVVMVRRSFPQTTGEAGLPGLAAPVEVVRDAHGIPQIYADTTADLMRAQGYVHAQERFYEMDVRRHATAGRLAELFGERAVAGDALVRTLGWRRVAERELPLLDPDTRTALDAYADGVNAYLADRSPRSIALEYAVLNLGGADYRPEPWTPVDSLSWLKAMAWDLKGNLDEEVDRALSIAAVGRERGARLFPRYPSGQQTPAVTQGAVVDGVFEQNAERSDTRNPVRPAPFLSSGKAVEPLRAAARALDAAPSWLGRGDGLGSNAWVVAGDHTTTGGPLLLNDPHLGVSLPGVWTQVGLHCRAVTDACPYDVAGFSFSGVPGVVIGRNADIAWGFTNLGADVTDLFVERVRPGDGIRDRYRTAGGWRPMRTRTERIEVADGDAVEIQVRATAHGPVLSDVDDRVASLPGEPDSGFPTPSGAREGEQYAVALSWTALRPSRTADAILALNRAGGWDEFRDALADFAAPGQNVVYADREGHVGYQATGLVPIRKSGNDGRLPSAGWRPENEWTGQFVPYDGLPSVLDPEEGFVVTANQAVVGPRYPFLLTHDWERGYRSERIRDLLTDAIADGPVSPGQLLAMQTDDRNPAAPTLVPYLLDVDLDPVYTDDGQQLLAEWDFDQPADSAAAAYFNVVWRDLLALTFDDELAGLDVHADGGQRWVAVLTRLLGRPDDPWWDDVDTEGRETRDDVLRRAMTEARDDLTRLISPEAADWTWGALHELRLESPTLGASGIGVVERLFNRGGWEAAGGTGAVDATSWDAATGFGVTAAPSMRMLVDPTDPDAARWVALGGVSGHAFHPHYSDQVDVLLDGDTLPWPFTEDAVRDAGEDVLTLVP